MLSGGGDWNARVERGWIPLVYNNVYREHHDRPVRVSASHLEKRISHLVHPIDLR